MDVRINFGFLGRADLGTVTYKNVKDFVEAKNNLIAYLKKTNLVPINMVCTEIQENE